MSVYGPLSIVCADCQVSKTTDQFYFRADRRSYRNICRACERIRRKEREARDAELKERQLAHVRVWRRNNPGKIREAADGRYKSEPGQSGRKGLVWTSAEIAVAARPDATDRQVARKLGRSISAVQNIRHRIATEPRYARLAEEDLGDLAAPAVINLKHGGGRDGHHQDR
jgi:hypothetical protein